VSNLICRKLDRELRDWAAERHLTYTRYADDLTFSTSEREVPVGLATMDDGAWTVGAEVAAIIATNGFTPNPAKFRIAIRGKNRQVVTGLKVTSKLNVRRSYVRQLRSMLHAWEKFGLEAANVVYQFRFDWRHRSPTAPLANFENVVRGKLAFLRMIKGADDGVYEALRARYERLRTIGAQRAGANLENAAAELLQHSVALPEATAVRRAVRIVIVSPSDTSTEVASIRQAIEELNGFLPRWGTTLEPWHWSTEAYPGFHAEGPQGHLDTLQRIDEADLVIGVFWQRLGTALPDGMTGTEHEMKRAIEANAHTGKPAIWIYFSQRRSPPPESEDDLQQLRRLLTFRKEMEPLGLYRPLTRDVAKILRQHLMLWLADRKMLTLPT
jgi:hypothetical protein